MAGGNSTQAPPAKAVSDAEFRRAVDGLTSTTAEVKRFTANAEEELQRQAEAAERRFHDYEDRLARLEKRLARASVMLVVRED